MATRTVQSSPDGDLGRLRGATVGDRIGDALERSGLTKAELARRVGKSWRQVHGWINGEKSPSGDSLRRLAEALGVTVDELLGIAEGQDPPFASWTSFLETPDGAGMTAGERRALQSIAWPPGREPTVASYHIALAAMRSTTDRPL